MEATTYRDPEVRAVLAKTFLVAKVDSDARPDIQERYEAWGWPATVIFAPDGSEIATYRGYVEPAKFRSLLAEIAERGVSASTKDVPRLRENPSAPLATEHLRWIRDLAARELDEYYDPEQGSWGRRQKAPIGPSNAWKLRLAARGDARATNEVAFTLDQQAKLIDPVWGGIYQYSTDGDWDHPHFEKLMSFQAYAIDNYATAYAQTKEAKSLARAQAVRAFVDRFMRGAEGGFFASQDADLHAHEPNKPFMDGHAYYALGENERLRRGAPRVDTHEYARENGLGIAAYVSLGLAAGDASLVTEAARAARRILATHKVVGRGVTHGPAPNGGDPLPMFLADNAAMAFGLVRLGAADGDAGWIREAMGLTDAALALLFDVRSGGFYSVTADPNASGVFAERRVPFEDNVTMIRTLVALASHKDVPKVKRELYAKAAERALRALSTVDEIKGRGRWIGDYLMAVDDVLVMRDAASRK